MNLPSLLKFNRVSLLQWLAAMVILIGFFGATFLPAFKSGVELDTGLIETVKNIALIVVGWLFGASTRDTNSSPTTPPAAAQPPKDLPQ